ncbi:hypothetical protein V5E97_06885 [Singulisphaera sp. Ch08]|uniref:Uncharacterized protein n=1 Tax=Singulisphaera sp. Ch08 TaxID=3120278 RepID=A0AAU7CKD3_9BACT
MNTIKTRKPRASKKTAILTPAAPIVDPLKIQLADAEIHRVLSDLADSLHDPNRVGMAELLRIIADDYVSAKMVQNAARSVAHDHDLKPTESVKHLLRVVEATRDFKLSKKRS